MMWPTLLCLLGGIGLLALMLQLRQKLFCHYDWRADDHYDFRNADARMALSLQQGQASLPDLPLGSYCCILSLKVSATPLGWLLLPRITVSTCRGKLSFAFEFGARGRRYVDVTQLFNGEERIARISLHGRGARVSEAAELFLFRQAPLDGKSICIFSPHPDDAEIAAFGVYSAHAPRAQIVNVLAGDSGGWSYGALYETQAENFQEKGFVRVIDSLTAPMFGGVPAKNVCNLGYFSGRLEQMYKAPTRAFGAQFSNVTDLRVYRNLNVASLPPHDGLSTWENLIDDLEFQLRTHCPEVIFLPHPVLDSHLDHQYVALAVYEALARCRLENLEIWLYTNHPHLTQFHPYGPADCGLGLPPSREPYALGVPRSIALSKEIRRRKLLALETMHDLRSLRLRSGIGLINRGWQVSLREGIYAWAKAFHGGGSDYFRQSIRSSEVFYLVTQGELREQIKRAGLPVEAH